MSILINMEMPTSCILCDLSHEDGWCPVKKDYIDRYSFETCPLVPVPEHGDLIDRDVLRAEVKKYATPSDAWVFSLIRTAHTIIPAELSKEE